MNLLTALPTDSTCPCCGTLIRKNERKINESLLFFLIEICERFFAERNEDGIKYDLIFNLIKAKYQRTPSDYAVLEKFQLIKKVDSKPGYWKPTRKAYEFLSNQTSIPRYLFELGNKMSFSEEQVYVWQISNVSYTPSWSSLHNREIVSRKITELKTQVGSL